MGWRHARAIANAVRILLTTHLDEQAIAVARRVGP